MYSKIGIVIVSHNASLAVRATLASIKQAKNSNSYKLILVDNGSKKDELEKIKIAFQKHISDGNLEWAFQPLTDNLGFAGGNNHGIKLFMHDPEISHVCLLNSDVIVTDYWLDRLVEKGCDIISTVTNKADCEQCVPIGYKLELADCIDTENEEVPVFAYETILNHSENWYQAWKGNIVEADITFFCVLLTKALIDKVGLLDERFFPGGYEDDDYCLRVEEAGFKTYLARDIFIHHFGSASFGQLKAAYFINKASLNRDYLETKYSISVKRRHERPLTSFS